MKRANFCITSTFLSSLIFIIYVLLLFAEVEPPQTYNGHIVVPSPSKGSKIIKSLNFSVKLGFFKTTNCIVSEQQQQGRYRIHWMCSEWAVTVVRYLCKTRWQPHLRIACADPQQIRRKKTLLSLYSGYETYSTVTHTPLELNRHQGSIKRLILSEWALLLLYISLFLCGRKSQRASNRH